MTATVARSTTSGNSRALQLRMRPDLRIEHQTYLGRRYWVVKDPIALKYYRFEEEEIALLEMLDGKSSLEDIQARFEERFAPQKITLQELHQLVGMLHRSALVVSDAERQGPQLLKRHREQTRRQRLSSVTNVLCIRFKGFDPDHTLGWLDRRVGWFFSPACFAACISLAIGALLLITAQFDVFQAKLPSFEDFFASKNWIWLTLTLAATKVLHEFGHGLSCKRFGGECHEMGAMLLVLTPCLYCNVSDSWMLPSKWKRAAIGAAGMYVEVVLASICTFVWWFTQPGLLNYLCLNVMFISSVSTLLFNANPLLRYDGYYILSDLIEIPNLRQKATTILQSKLASWTLGIPETPDPFLPQRRQWLFAIYTVAAAIYKWVVMAAILWFLYVVFEPYGLQVIGKLITVMAVGGLVFQPLWKLGKFFYVPGRIDRVKKPRMFASAAVATTVVVAIFMLPIPHYVRCAFYIQPRGAASVYVESSGELRQIHAEPGQAVQAGDSIVTLDDVELKITLVRLEGEKQVLETKLASLRQRAFEDESAALEIAEVEESIVAIDDQLSRRQRELESMRIVAPVAGVIIPPPTVTKPQDDPSRLPTWSGSTFDQRNTHAFLVEGTPVCQVGDPTKVEAVLAIDQSDIEFVHPGQSIEIFVNQLPGQRLRTQLEQVSRLDMKVAPKGLSSKNGGDVITQTDASGQERPMNTTYQANASIQSNANELLIGVTGQAKIHTGYQTVANRIWRYICQTFDFSV
ncbi:MAG: HlyD family efflux transporter periplasmic adaptor subunit [Planctomycetaceae bacterium]|nr:HlyD family efflux transporter periplasmic adaptor subunit [Planctomycetales bacterium]MCB9921591.1 HlyD family efflux transporter periplasmic adaptor subunit [Planctomycetaceae bacterium]